MRSSDTTVRRPFALDRKLIVVILTALIGALTIGIVVTGEPYLALIGIAATLFMLALMRWPDVATLLVIFYIYTNVGAVALKFHNVPSVIATALVPMLLVIPLIWYVLVRRQELIITPVLQLLLALAIVYLLGAALSVDITLAIPQLTEYFVEGLLLYFLVTNVVRTPVMLKRVVWVLLVSGGLIGGLSLYQQVTGTFDNNYGGFAQVASSFGTGVEELQGQVEQPRLAGSIGEQNRYGQIMLMLAPLGLFQLWIYRSTGARVMALILTALIVIGGTLSFSRGAAVGFVLMIVVLVFLRYITVKQLMILLVGVGLVLALFPQYALRLTSLNVLSTVVTPDSGPALAGADNSIRDRASEMLAALLVFRDHPVFGVGPGMVRYYTRDYAREIGISSLPGDFQAHNLFLGIAGDAGLLGLICFVLILYIPLRDLARARKRWMVTRPDLSNLATAFFQALIGYIVTGLFLHLSYYRFFYLMIALAVVASSFKDSDVLSDSESVEGELSPVEG